MDGNLANKEKKVKEKKGKSIFVRIINLIIWIVLIAWAFCLITDYLNATNEKDPKFCISEETKEYSDGNVYICTGPGYKLIKYNRASYTATQFGGFWIEEYDPTNQN